MKPKILRFILVGGIVIIVVFILYLLNGRGQNYKTFQSAGSYPASFKIASVPYYAKKNFCYEASTMMILRYYGLDEKEVGNFRDLVDKEGKGGPPDAFMGLKKIGFWGKVNVAYSKNYNRSWESFYRQFLASPGGQTLLLENEQSAFSLLKKLVSSGTPVIALIDRGNHYVVVTGYDEKLIYINDPDPDVGKKEMPVNEFLAQWQNYKQDLGKGRGDMGFPGEFGMYWLQRYLDSETSLFKIDKD